jgi:hypothetical protein
VLCDAAMRHCLKIKRGVFWGVGDNSNEFQLGYRRVGISEELDTYVM